MVKSGIWEKSSLLLKKKKNVFDSFTKVLLVTKTHTKHKTTNQQMKLIQNKKCGGFI